MIMKKTPIFLAALVTVCFSIGGFIALGRDLLSRRTAVYLEARYVNNKMEEEEPVQTPSLTSQPRETVYLVMPTYLRLVQRSLLTMQCQTLSQVANLHLILIEDAPKPTQSLTQLMSKHRLNFTHLACSSKDFCKRVNCTSKNFTAKGSVPRNCGLTWLQYKQIKTGVIYFADDDNFYQLELFDELRRTRNVGLFPVGGFSGTWMSSPLIKDGKITDFVDPWKAKRKWPIDMAGFSVSVKFWQERGCPKFTYRKGYLETKFIEALNASRKDIDVLADGATKVYVWHNSIRKSKCLDRRRMKNLEKYSNYRALRETLPIC